MLKSTRSRRCYLRPHTSLVMAMCVGVLLLEGPAGAQTAVDLQALTQETQKHSREANAWTLVWWIPEQFWQANLAQNPMTTQAQIEAILQAVRRYTMVVIGDGRMGAFGGVTYTPEESVRSGVTVRDPWGGIHPPLAGAEVDVDTRTLLLMVKPIIANILGTLGQNMHFVVFPSQTKEGRPIADATGTGTFTVVLRSTEYRYRLPLGSVLPPKYDPKTGEKFPGNYLFSPFTGGPLTP
jgi:hypothetical protein